MEEFLTSLGINEPLEKDNDGMFFEVENFDQLLRYFSMFDKSDLVDDVDDDYMEEDGSEMKFTSDKYDISLEGDFVNDIYKVKIKEK